MYTYIYIYIYIYTHTHLRPARCKRAFSSTASPQSKNLHVGGFGSSRVLIVRVGTPRSIGKCPEPGTQRF